MDWNDQPATQPAPTPLVAATESRSAFGGMKRTAATALLAVGLLVVGGVAAVNAADPSTSPAPSAATTQPSTGTNGTGNGNAAPGGSTQGRDPTSAG